MRGAGQGWLIGCALVAGLVAGSLLAGCAGGQAGGRGEALVGLKVRYHMPDAGQVLLVWGIDGWQPVAEELWPSGTFLDGTMRTPMAREGGAFVARLQVPAWTDVNFGFRIVEGKDGAPLNIWECDEEEDCRTTAWGKDAVVTVETKLRLEGAEAVRIVDDLPLVRREIRYWLPGAGEVFLVWGIDDGYLVPQEIRPPGTVTAPGGMHSPMAREGDFFVSAVRVPGGARLYYSFRVSRTLDGTALENVWDQSSAYSLVVLEDGVTEVRARLMLAQEPGSERLAVIPLVNQQIGCRLAVAREIWLVWRLEGGDWMPEERRPPGTVVRDGFLRTPMTQVADNFTTELQVPAGRTLEYMCLVTSVLGSDAVEIWQPAPENPYRLTPTEDGQVEVAVEP